MKERIESTRKGQMTVNSNSRFRKNIIMIAIRV